MAQMRRGLPQTVFFCPACKGDRRRRRDCVPCGGFGKLTKESVQELIARRLVPAMQAKHGVFYGAGHEDVDVLMLGRGRRGRRDRVWRERDVGVGASDQESAGRRSPASRCSSAVGEVGGA